MSELLRCDACGGAIVYQVQAQAGACLFCGSQALQVAPASERAPRDPDAWIPPHVDAAEAHARFKAWANASWWRPKDLHQAETALRLVLIPAWRLDAAMETHWAGLRHAATRSGKRPASGVSHGDAHTMVPASGALTQGELLALEPFDEGGRRPWPPPEPDALPHEPPQLSAQAARARAHAIMAAWHQAEIEEAEDLLSCNVSPLFHDGALSLLAVPVYIGVFRYRERPWRLLVNAQTGEVVGDAPVDRAKVVGSLLLFVAVLAALWAAAT